MADIFREVDEEVRQDRIQLAVMRNWGWLLLGALLVVAGVGAWRGYDYWRIQQEEASGGRYLAALNAARDGKTADMLTALEDLARTGTPGYGLLARFRAAGQIGLANAADGAKAYDALAADPKVDTSLQDVARLRAAILLLDTADLKTMQGRLQPLTDANSPMRSSAREILAIAALKGNDLDAAARALEAIVADPGAAVLARQRATALLSLARAGSSGGATTP